MELEKTLIELTRRIVCALVDHPELVEVLVDGTDDDVCRILIQTGPGEMGQIIGKQGRNLDALRTVVYSCAGKYGRRAAVELLEPEPPVLGNRQDAPDVGGESGERQASRIDNHRRLQARAQESRCRLVKTSECIDCTGRHTPDFRLSTLDPD